MSTTPDWYPKEKLEAYVQSLRQESKTVERDEPKAVARSVRRFILHPSGLREKAGRIPSAKNGARPIRRWTR